MRPRLADDFENTAACLVAFRRGLENFFANNHCYPAMFAARIFSRPNRHTFKTVRPTVPKQKFERAIAMKAIFCSEHMFLD